MQTEQFLKGKNVLVTRERGQSNQLRSEIINYGGVPIMVPLLSIREPREAIKKHSLAAIAKVSQYDWIIFTSRNGVEFFFKLLAEVNVHLTSKQKFAVIGTKTAEALKRYGYTPSFIAPSFVAEAFLPSFLEILNKDETVVIYKGNLARNYIAQGIQAQGITIDEVIVYENVVPEDAEANLQKAILTCKIDLILFTSPSTVENFITIIQKNQLIEEIRDSVIVVIGPVTKKKAESIGLSVSICAEQYTVTGMLTQMKKFYEEREFEGNNQ